MRTNLLIISSVLLSSLLTSSAIAADATPDKDRGMVTEASRPPETISNTPIGSTPGAAHDEKDCPMHKANKDGMEKHGAPCPYDLDKNHQGKTHEKCDHGQRS